MPESLPPLADALPCHDLTHGAAGAAIIYRLHHHGPGGERVGHARFGTCVWCERLYGLYGAPTPAEPIFPAQTCPSCGAEHPGEPCGAYDGDLFGGAR